MSAQEAQIAAVLAEHWHAGMGERGGMWECGCGAPMDMSDDAHRAHVAAALDAALGEREGSLPSWCVCPDDCDCDGALVPPGLCEERAGETLAWCQLRRGHDGWHVCGGHRWDRSQDRIEAEVATP